MRLNEPLLVELQIEAATTVQLLLQIPEHALSWRPHPRSRSAAELASHIAEIPGLFLALLDRDTFDRREPGWVASTIDELKARFDGNVERAADILGRLDDDRMMEAWSYFVLGRPVFRMPRFVVARTTALNHLIHHRGQLTVYLRLLEVPLPPIYGPTADSVLPAAPVDGYVNEPSAQPTPGRPG